jgi:acetyl esterase/lipase
MNLKLISLAALLVSSISAFSADSLDEKQFQKLMKEVGDTTKRVKPGIESKDADQLNKDASRLAERARKAGVTVSYEPWERMIHVWHLFAPMLDEGQQAIDRIGDFVRKQAA